MSKVRGLRNRRYQPLIDAALRAGWSKRIDGSGHLLLSPPGGGRSVAISLSLDDTNPRDYLNTRAALRRGGVPV